MVEDNVITIHRGDDERLTLTIDDYEFKEGDIVVLSVREIPSPSSPLLLEVVSSSPSFNLPHEKTERIPAGKYSYDVELRILQADGSYYIKTIVPTPEDEHIKNGTDKNWKNFIMNGEVTTGG